MSLPIQTSKLTEAQAAHLLRRATFGTSPNRIKEYIGLRPEEAVEKLLGGGATAAPPIDPVTGETFHDKPFDTENASKQIGYVKGWWIAQMMQPEKALQEKMVLFWQNHFSISHAQIADPRYLYRYNVLLRKYALGNFRSLAVEMTKEPAMLRYLNGNTNTAKRPNENYARELQELFTIGANNYTEDDVKAAARVLTGWDDNGYRATATATVETVFILKNHDTTDKVFSASYGNKVIKGQTTDAGGELELTQLIEMITSRRESALFICRKLYRWFIHSSITTTIEKNIISPLADLLIKSNFELRPVVKNLLTSKEFFKALHVGSIIKSPLDFVIGLLTHYEVNLAAIQTDPMAYYGSLASVARQTADLQQDLMNQPSVFGWPAYYDTGYYQLWLNSNTFYKRNGVTDAVFTNGLVLGTYRFRLDTVEMAQKTSKPSDPVVLMKELTKALFIVELSQEQLDYLVDQVLLPDDLPRMEWTITWNLLAADFNNTKNRKVISTMLDRAFKYLFRMAEYQLC